MPKPGYITASQIKPLMVDGRTKPPFGRGAVTLSRQLARQIIGIDEEEFNSKDIERGNKLEDVAIACFERTFRIEIERPEFMIHPEVGFFGGTPDGLTFDFGIDTKCPNQKNHHDNLSEGMQLKKYKHQFQSYMAITGLDKWALVSYNPDFTKDTRLAVEWMERDEAYIEKLLSRIKKFEPVVIEEAKRLKNYTNKSKELVA